MRTLDPAFAAHVASGETTLCFCWRLIRSDGLVLGFTDHDATLAFEDTRFAPASGGDGSELAAKLGAATDTSEIVAVLSSPAIREDDIRLGRFAGAEVETWRVNWRDTAVRHLLRRDSIGEITLADSVFRAELRSAQADLNRKKGRLYSALCGTVLGSSACGIDLAAPAFHADAEVLSVIGARRVRVTGLSTFESGWFSFGRATWASGLKSGLVDIIDMHGRDASGDWLDLDSEVADWVAPGDTLGVTAGCDRSFATCRDRFGNGACFRGFPHIPGSDFVLVYPKQGQALSGAVLVP